LLEAYPAKAGIDTRRYQPYLSADFPSMVPAEKSAAHFIVAPPVLNTAEIILSIITPIIGSRRTQTKCDHGRLADWTISGAFWHNLKQI
jgi:hypothetical protein